MKEEQNIDREVLFFRYCNGTASAAEKDKIENIIAVSPEALTELNAVREVIETEKRIREMESYDITAGYRHVQKNIQKANRRKRFVLILSRTAAILVLPLLISTFTFAYMAFSNQENDPVVYAEIAAAPGTVTRFELPDKSRVWLNANAVLRYPSRFEGTAREVTLEGEGYFEVESDKEHPFYVTTKSGMKVMAYGTRFNINTEKNVIETVLAEGRVGVFYQDTILKELVPEQQASFNQRTGAIEVSKINLQEKLAWKDGKIIFRNAPLHEVFEQLSRRYNVDIILHDEHNQSGKYLSRVTFTDETIQQIFSYLEIAAPIQWKLSSPIQNKDSTLVRQRIDVWLKKKK